GTISATTDASGHADFAASLGSAPGRPYITATATDPSGNTSEFSAWLSTGAVVSPLLTIQRTNSTQLIVTWPASTSPGLLLQNTTNLTPVVFWSAVTNSVPTNGAIQYVILDLNSNEPQRYFRLSQ